MILSSSLQSLGSINISLLANVMIEFFFSGYGVPVENMPSLLQKLANIFPIYHYMIIFRAILLKGVGLDVIWPQIMAGLAIGVVVIPVAIWFLGRQQWD